jgi:16S rRNA (cytosine1402-N4)-methyltransferase
MRFNVNSGINASRFLHQSSQQDLARIIKKYSDERFSSKISKAIKSKGNLKTTFDLKNAIDEVTPTHKRSKTYARVFQAIRIAVNEELEKLKKFFNLFLHGLKPGSRVVLISYHSIEDRIVKHSLKGLKNDEKIKLLTKKPIIPQRKEIIINPKSRSAKLRAIEVL